MDLSLRQLSKAFGPRHVLDRVDLELVGVRALVLIGPSGGGKSTLLRLLGGLEIPDAGQVVVDGAPLPFHDPDALRRYRRQTGFVFQGHNLFPHLTALENITLPLVHAHGFTPSDARDEALALLKRFNLESHAHQSPAHLSGGQKQRIAIARALAIKARRVLLDEPTSALDPEMTAEVLDMIAELRAENRDLVLVTHQMAFARRVADHVAFVARSNIAAHGPTEALLGNPESPLVRAFLERVLAY